MAHCAHDSALTPPSICLSRYVSVVLSVLLAWALPGFVCAQPATSVSSSLAGTWRAGTTTMTVSIESWGEDCGPRPQSSRASGGGTVRVSDDGPELVIHGKGHLVRTDECWSRNPAMRRSSSRFLDGKWTTLCQTPTDDPREETGTYTIARLSDGELRYLDVSEYNWKLKSSRCTATITTVQTLLRAGKQGQTKPNAPANEAPTAAMAAEPASKGAEAAPVAAKPDTTRTTMTAPKKPRPSCTPGLAAQVIVSPTQAELELGQELCVRAKALDDRNCPLPQGALSYSLEHSPALKAVLDGPCFSASTNAAEGEGEYKLIASAGDLTAETRILVTSRDLSSLIAKRLEVGAVTGFEQVPELANPAPPTPATKVSAEPVAARDSGKAPLVLLLLGVAVLVLGGALVLLRMRNQPALPKGRDATASGQGRRETAPDAAPVTTLPQEDAHTEAAPRMATVSYGQSADIETWICPNCRRGFPATKIHCPRCLPEEHRLLPYAEFQAQQSEAATPKLCVDCNATWPGSTNFCGQCGSRNLQQVGQDQSQNET